MLFEKELRNMKVFCFNLSLKNNYYKTLMFKLSAIKATHKKSLLSEYFNMCKMLYRVRSLVAYTLYEGKEDLIFQLYNNQSDLAKMVQKVKKNMLNLFGNTDPNHCLLGDNRGTRNIRITRTLTEK